MMRRALMVVILSLSFAATAQAAMKIDVSENNIHVTTGFNGTSITVFGIQQENGHVVIVIEGPNKDFIVRKKGRTLGLWTNVDSREFKNVPGYYEAAASAPLPAIATPDVLAQYRIGIDTLPIFDKRKSNSVRTLAFRDAFIEGQKNRGLYVTNTQPLDYISENLFKARFTLPAEVPSGRYGVYAYLFVDGVMVQQDQTRFEVRPIGMSADMRRFAHDNSLLYGLVAVMIAVFAGWLATVLLKRE